MTKNDFVRRLQDRFKGEFKQDELERLVVGIFDELKLVIREGDELHLNHFGRFYGKHMAARVVRGGWYADSQREYVVPAKTKIGFSSFPRVDREVSEKLPARKTDGIFDDI